MINTNLLSILLIFRYNARYHAQRLLTVRTGLAKGPFFFFVENVDFGSLCRFFVCVGSLSVSVVVENVDFGSLLCVGSLFCAGSLSVSNMFYFRRSSLTTTPTFFLLAMVLAFFFVGH